MSALVQEITTCLTGSGGPVKFDDDGLESLVKSDPRLSVQELSKSLGSTWTQLYTFAYVKSARCTDKEYELGTNKDLRRTVCTSSDCAEIVTGETRNGSSVTT